MRGRGDNTLLIKLKIKYYHRGILDSPVETLLGPISSVRPTF